MDSSPENFETLRKLLRLKRYEQPPPRYFNEFSGNVIARLRAGEGRRTPRWWERFGFDLRPVLTVGAGSLACGMLLATVGFSFDSNDASQLGMSANAALLAGANGEEASGSPATDAFTTVAGDNEVSTNPVVSRGMFAPTLRRGLAMPVSFSH